MSRSNEPLEQLSLAKSNDLISSKYKSSLLENQIAAIAWTRIETRKTDGKVRLKACLYPGELKKLISDETHIYRDLATVSQRMTGHTMFIEDGKGNFVAFPMVTDAKYINGIFEIEFSENLRGHTVDLENKFTVMELAILTEFRRNTSFRLYELLKKDAYKIPEPTEEEPDPYVLVEYDIYELRFMIGLANSDSEDVKIAISNQKRDIDWEAVYNKLDKKDKKYSDWTDMRRYVFDTAMEEMKEISDIRFEYKGIPIRRAYRRVKFFIYRNVPAKSENIDLKVKIMEENRQMEMPYDMYPALYDEYVGHNGLIKEDITILLEKSSYDVDMIKAAIKAADEASMTTHVNNYMGWIIRYIESGGWKKTAVSHGSSELPRMADEILDDYNNEDKEEVAKRVWENTKKKEDFPKYVEALNKIGIDIDTLEKIMSSYQKLFNSYVKWHNEGVIEL